MPAQPSLSSIAHLIAEPTRAVMLTALADGRAWPAGELARVAEVTAQTASAHLAKLLAGGLLAVSCEGRLRRYRLAGAHVALALETLASISASMPSRQPPHRHAQSLRFARCCYDHLAGRLGVAITQALQRREVIVAEAEGRFVVTAAGWRWFEHIGLQPQGLPHERSDIARQCLDWSEHACHLAGPLGAQWLRQLCANGWLRRARATRAIQVTPQGWLALREQLGIERNALCAAG